MLRKVYHDGTTRHMMTKHLDDPFGAIEIEYEYTPERGAAVDKVTSKIKASSTPRADHPVDLLVEWSPWQASVFEGHYQNDLVEHALADREEALSWAA